jgi:hypothetical protein
MKLHGAGRLGNPFKGREIGQEVREFLLVQTPALNLVFGG